MGRWVPAWLLPSTPAAHLAVQGRGRVLPARGPPSSPSPPHHHPQCVCRQWVSVPAAPRPIFPLTAGSQTPCHGPGKIRCGSEFWPPRQAPVKPCPIRDGGSPVLSKLPTFKETRNLGCLCNAPLFTFDNKFQFCKDSQQGWLIENMSVPRHVCYTQSHWAVCPVEALATVPVGVVPPPVAWGPCTVH